MTPIITNIKQLDRGKHYTYADYLTWQLEEMVELIKGKIFPKSPAPGTAHQWVSNELQGIIYTYLQGKNCKVFSAPFDVRLPLPPHQQKADKIDTVVQPDLCVICDLGKLDSKGCNGAPDWIIEILSKSTSQKDLTDKFSIYQNAGVREYWVVHPHEGTVLAFRLDKDGHYQSLRSNPFVQNEAIPVGIFPDFEVPLSGVFPEEDL